MRTHTRDHGYAILAAKPREAGRIIIAFREDRDFDRFVVWREDAEGSCHGGQYVETLDRANQLFKAR
jgi:hypothetical protein